MPPTVDTFMCTNVSCLIMNLGQWQSLSEVGLEEKSHLLTPGDTACPAQ